MFFNNHYVDLHCHPALKPFGKSFNKKPPGVQSGNRSHKSSLWYYDPPSLADKLLNFISGLSKFSQSNLTALAKGGVSTTCISLYPLEKWFVRNKIKNELIADLLANFAMGIGDKRIDYIQGITDYFKDLEDEYNFYRQWDGKIKNLPEGKFLYKLVSTYKEIENIRQAESQNPGIQTICLIVTIEGLHVLNTGLRKKSNPDELLRNMDRIKNWEYPPFFITIAHHFWNEICGHAPSLTKLVQKKTNQSEGLSSGITPMGINILKRMLDSGQGRRIWPDLKHMNRKSRDEFYILRENGSLGITKIPLIVSHGACNGLRSFKEPVIEGSRVSAKLNPVEINFYNDEIIRLAQSDGILGFQIDERRIVNKATLKQTKHSLKRHKIMHYRSELLWNQVQHMAEVLDAQGLPAWDHMAIGSDYDGIIDSLNGFWTSEELPFLADFLERHAFNYRNEFKMKQEFNNIDADEIIHKLMSANAHRFMKKYFKA